MRLGLEIVTFTGKRNGLGPRVDFGPFHMLQLNLAGGLPTEVGKMQLDTEHIHTLSAVLAATDSVMSLDLRCNRVLPAGLQLLAEMLMDNRSITSLDLSQNLLGAGESACEVVEVDENRDAHGTIIPQQRITESDHSLQRNADNINFDRHAVPSHEGLEALAHALRHNNTLVELNLANNFLGRLERSSPRGAMVQGPYSHGGISVLLKCLRVNTGIVRLDLGDNPCAPMLGKEIGLMLRSNHTIGYLRLSRMQLIGAQSMGPLAQGLAANMSLSVRICNCFVMLHVCCFLATFLMWSFLNLSQVLDLSSNILDSDGAEELAKGLRQNTTIRSLILRGCRIWADGCAALAQALQNRQSIVGSPINKSFAQSVELATSDDMEAVNDVGRIGSGHSRVTANMDLLDLRDCLIMRRSPNFKDAVFAGIDSLAELLANPRCGVKRLRLAGNDLRDSGCKHLANGIRKAIDQVNAKRNRYHEMRKIMLDEESSSDEESQLDVKRAKQAAEFQSFFVNNGGMTVAQVEMAHEAARRAANAAEDAYKHPTKKLTAAEAKEARIAAKKARATEQRVQVRFCHRCSCLPIHKDAS